jgi:hypothetical protein
MNRFVCYLPNGRFRVLITRRQRRVYERRRFPNVSATEIGRRTNHRLVRTASQSRLKRPVSKFNCGQDREEG